jgi:hypothetical protein
MQKHLLTQYFHSGLQDKTMSEIFNYFFHDSVLEEGKINNYLG